MRIPLDYYRILGLPFKTSDEQLSQAYRDRSLQLPRKEYTEVGISSRQQILHQAYEILSNPSTRDDYNRKFLEPLETDETTESSEEDDFTPSLEIQPSQIIGTIIIFLELGEYELVERIGTPYLKEVKAQIEQNPTPKLKQLHSDLVLTLAIASSELCAESWQQGEYEQAAHGALQAISLLQNEHLFSYIQERLTQDLALLAPYRILELLHSGEEKERKKGLDLLREMLIKRGGIDGTGDDGSGLDVNDFLRFIQQVRSYLTADEQQEIFEEEATEHSCAVAAYLAAYALIAKGFSLREPDLLVRALHWLDLIIKRQDVSLEQATCYLLLGQPEESLAVLEHSKDGEVLDFIKKNSPNSPDLLPGLCLYAKYWLDNQVFPHFRDLMNEEASLTDFFGNPQVQQYLESLSTNFNTNTSTSVSLPQEHKLTGKPTVKQHSIHTIPDNYDDHSTIEKSQLTQDLPQTPLSKSRKKSKTTYSSRKNSTLYKTWIRLGLLGMILMVLLLLIYNFLAGKPAENNPPPSQPENLRTQPKPPLSNILEPDSARQVIATWLTAKTMAYGKNYQVAVLDNILAEPLLSQNRSRVQVLKKGNSYREFQHHLSITSVKLVSPTSAIVQAKVREMAKQYYVGQSVPTNSYNETLNIKYQLVRTGQQWKIKSVDILR